MLEGDIKDGAHVVVGERVIDDLSFASSRDEFCEFEHLELVGDGGFGDAQKDGEVTDTEFDMGEDLKDPQSIGISEMAQ